MSMAGSSRSANGSLPKRSLSATQAATAPGTLTESQPRIGGALAPSPYLRLKYSGVHAAGAGPDAFRPCSCFPSHRMQKASRAQAVAARLDDGHRRRGGDGRVDRVAAGIRSMRRPACAASGCEVETMLRANTGRRGVAYSVLQSKAWFMGEFRMGSRARRGPPRQVLHCRVCRAIPVSSQLA